MPELGVIQRTVAETPWDTVDLAATCERVTDLGYRGIELSGGGLAGLDPGELGAALDSAGLAVPATHVGTDLVDGSIELGDSGDGLAGDPARTARAYREVGCTDFATGNPIDIETPGDLDRAVDAVAAFADRLADHGVTLHYHNHAHEFHEVGGRNFFDELAAGTDVAFEVDVGHVERGGRDPVSVLEGLAGRVDIVHMSDVDTEGNVVEVGDGIVDLAACAEAAADIGAEWLVYEYNQTTDHRTSLEHAAEYLGSL